MTLLQLDQPKQENEKYINITSSISPFINPKLIAFITRNSTLTINLIIINLHHQYLFE
jgi:hypothetical protein